MIYLDSSVALASIFTERIAPPASFWTQVLSSSRLLEYEIMNRVHARNGGVAELALARRMLRAIRFTELTPDVLARALQPFPVPVRTLDGLHLATMDFLRANGQTIEVATYDVRLAQSAQALGFPIAAM
jgi:PIN domain